MDDERPASELRPVGQRHRDHARWRTGLSASAHASECWCPMKCEPNRKAEARVMDDERLRFRGGLQ